MENILTLFTDLGFSAESLVLIALGIFAYKNLQGKITAGEKSMERMQRTIERMQQSIENLQATTSTIVGWIQAQTGQPLSLPSSASSSTTPKSPLDLTPRGIKNAEALQADAIVEKYWQEVPLPEDPTRLAIQNACWNFASLRLQAIMTPEEQKRLQEVCFEDGGDMRQILSIFAILLRNRIFQDRNIPISKPDQPHPKESEPEAEIQTESEA
ncbi:MAG: hypothetical protein GDA55_00720 [Cellvibrionales bacterium]|nr:hypothetical protein [Cellvibrionales bacterium]